MPLPRPIAESFRRQADGCFLLGSPFTALVCRLLADRLEPAGLFASRIGSWSGDPKDDALPLRAAGGLHALARTGGCPPLTAAYPPNPADADTVWAGIKAAIEAEDAFLSAYLDGPPQTNEVARSDPSMSSGSTLSQASGRSEVASAPARRIAALSRSFVPAAR